MADRKSPRPQAGQRVTLLAETGRPAGQATILRELVHDQTAC